MVHGIGKEINKTIYEGQFKNDVYHGYGRFIYEDASYYIGNWVDGKRDGKGQMVDTNNIVSKGKWRNDKILYGINSYN